MIPYLTDAFHCEAHTLQISLGGIRRRESDYEKVQSRRQHAGRPHRIQIPALTGQRESIILAFNIGLVCSPSGCLRRRPFPNAAAHCHHRASCNPYAYRRADCNPRAHCGANSDPRAYRRANGDPRAYGRTDGNP